MLQEIELGNSNTLLLFQNEDFWDVVLPKTFEDSPWIDIVTYNFNFNNYSQQSFYYRLKDLASKGVQIRLLFAKETFGESKLVEDVFRSFVLCAKLESNHSKIFLSDKIAYIGSANFSVGSNSNYECGIVIKNKEIIRKIRNTFLAELLEESKFIIIPTNPFDPLTDINGLIENVRAMVLLISQSSACLLQKENLELIPKLRYWDHIKYYLNKSNINFSFDFEYEFDWEDFYFRCYESQSVDDKMFHDFCDFIPKFYEHLKMLKEKLVSLYNINGKENIIPPFA